MSDKQESSYARRVDLLDSLKPAQPSYADEESTWESEMRHVTHDELRIPSHDAVEPLVAGIAGTIGDESEPASEDE